MRSWVYGYFGHDNLGDEAILESVVTNLRDVNQEPTVFTDNVSASLTTTRAHYLLGPPFDAGDGLRGLKYKLGYWLREGRRLLPAILLEKNVCIYACGGAINDHVPGRVATIARRIRKFKDLGFRVAILGAGVNPLVNETDKEAARAIVLELLDYCSVRDDESADALTAIGIPRQQFHVAADTVFSLRAPLYWTYRPGPLNAKRIGLNLRPLFEDTRERGTEKSQHHADYVRNTQTLIHKLSRSVADLDLIPLSPDDTSFFAKFSLPDNVRVLDFTARREDMMRRMAALDAFIGSRFHALVFSIMAGVPFVVIPYSPKVISLARSAGIEYAALIVGDGGEVIARDLDVDAVYNELTHTWDHAAEISRRFLSLAAQQSQSAKEDFLRCWSALTEAAGR